MADKKTENRFLFNNQKEDKIFSKNKKATIGATMTWIVATIIIIVVIGFFLYASWAIAGKKELGNVLSGESGFAYGSLISPTEMMRAIIKTKGINEKIKKRDFENLKKKLQPLLNNLPEYCKGYGKRVFRIYEYNDKGDKKVLLEVIGKPSVDLELNDNPFYFATGHYAIPYTSFDKVYTRVDSNLYVEMELKAPKNKCNQKFIH